MEDLEPFAVGGHEAVFDPVMHHLHKVSCTHRPAVEIPILWRKRLQKRLDPPENLPVAACHEAISLFKPPYAAAYADVHVMDAQRRKPLLMADIVFIKTVSAVDDHVVFPDHPGELLDSVVDRLPCRHHEPDYP